MSAPDEPGGAGAVEATEASSTAVALPWLVEYSSKAKKMRKKGLQPAEKVALEEVLGRIAIDPYTSGAELLIHDERWRYKFDGEARDLRMVFSIDPENRVVRILKIEHRGSIKYPGGRAGR